VEAAEVDARFERLLRTLDGLSGLLTAGGHRRWAAWVADDRRRIAGGDAYGLDHFLHAFGGMGSLGDVRLDVDDDQFRELRAQAYDDASALRRALDAP
jgi:hypothetical protein